MIKTSLSCRILSIACSTSSSTFAFSAAASTGTPPHSSYLNRSYGLTSPGLPSSRYVPSELTNMRQTSSNAMQQPHEVYPGAVYIYDLKTQRQKVC